MSQEQCAAATPYFCGVAAEILNAEILNAPERSQGAFFPCCTVHQPAHHHLQEDLSSHPVTDAFGIELFIATALDWVCGEHKAMTANGAVCPYISSCTEEESTWVNATLRREETFLRACAYDSWCVC